MDERDDGQRTEPALSWWDRVLRTLSGDPELVSVDRRVYRMICVCAGIICFGLVAPVNMLFDATGLANIPVAAFAIFMGFLYRRGLQGRYYPSVAVAAAVVFLDASWFLSGGSQGSPPAFVSAVCLFIAVYAARRTRFWGAVFILLNCTALFVADYYLPELRVPYASETNRFFDVALSTLVSVLTSLLILSVILDSHQWEQSRLETANLQLANNVAEIRTLRGMLPVCSWCHKVRDDQGLWTQVEMYLAQHTDTRLTHGICPECEQRYFTGEPSSTSPDKA